MNLGRKGNAAVNYAKKMGWAVIPLHSIDNGHCTCGNKNCTSAGKHPKTARGVKDATKNIDQVIKWWQRWPEANIGIATGRLSGFFVLDIDGRQGEESLSELEEKNGKLPDTVEQLTGGGGRHLLFEYVAIPNRVAIAPGIDIRSDTGYIVASPSDHISGLKYYWELSSLPGKIPIAEAPQWLINLLKPQVGLSRSADDWIELLREGKKEGERNNSIASLAGYLFRYLDPYVAVELLLLFNEHRCKPPLPEEELLRTIDSIAKLEARRRGAVR